MQTPANGVATRQSSLSLFRKAAVNSLYPPKIMAYGLKLPEFGSDFDGLPKLPPSLRSYFIS